MIEFSKKDATQLQYKYNSSVQEDKVGIKGEEWKT